MNRSADYWETLVRKLRKLPTETEWVEFKVNQCDPQQIGEYVSALANSAALEDRPYAYMVWGISDDDHAIVGTSFRPGDLRRGNEELKNWLLRLLNPQVNFSFFEVLVDGHTIVLLEIERARHQPVGFRGERYIRVGSYKKKLKDFRAMEQALWRVFDRSTFESGIVAERVNDDEVLHLIDYPTYFDLLGDRLPDNRSGILEALTSDRLIHPCKAGGWNMTNLAAVLFARRLAKFPTLLRKAVRVIQYRGKDRIRTRREQIGGKGYASGFEGLIGFINGLLPANERIGKALRKSLPLFPELAVRELVANALIHQDFSVTGAGPMVEIFEDRIEITNPGAPLVDTTRFVDLPPRSRNETLASLMRRLGICEERGSGWDKVAALSETHQLPAPLVEEVSNNTRVVLFAPRELSRMSGGEKVRTMYLHACLQYVKHEYLTNKSVRERFKIEVRNSAQASRLIKEAMQAGVIVLDDASAPPKLRRYVPKWAQS